MRSLKGLGLVHDTNYALFPQGAIKNETDNEEGTPVVREVYGDLLMNIYAILKDRGINLNDVEDSQQNGYQLLDALKLIYNQYLDASQILSKNGANWFINIDTSLIPDKAVLFVRSTEDMVKNISINVLDIAGEFLSVSPKTNVKTGDDCVLIYDASGGRLYSLNPDSSKEISIDSFVVYGNPIPQNKSLPIVWYFQSGILSNMNLEFYDIQDAVRRKFSNSTLEVRNVGQIDSYFLCLVYKPVDFSYSFVSFFNGNFSNPQEVSFVGFSPIFNGVEDYKVNVYFQNDEVFATNKAGNSIENNEISKFVFNPTTNQLIFQADILVNISFEKIQNTSIIDNRLISLDSSRISTYDFSGGKTTKETFGQLIGQLFRVADNIYFGNGYNAIKLVL
jgi:hypothetical protein